MSSSSPCRAPVSAQEIGDHDHRPRPRSGGATEGLGQTPRPRAHLATIEQAVRALASPALNEGLEPTDPGAEGTRACPDCDGRGGETIGDAWEGCARCVGTGELVTDWPAYLGEKSEGVEPSVGWRWVPVEPTDEMLDQGVAVLGRDPSSGFNSPWDVWAAMLSAAPPLPATPGAGSGGIAATAATGNA